ncbi:MAG: excinuclease ABC subunit C [Thermodesulfovibrio sp.]|nr:excinuclease ABC subunit C [Thermodesulfovibrio sp.]
MLERLKDIPEKPGVYIFRDEVNTVLYVGKAKGLRSRVRSYFHKSLSLDERKAAMVKLVKDFEYTVTGNELEAFVLEANLIKQYRPKYNILLRDDKSYPYLKLTLREEWPRLEVVRRIKKDGARYYGPYVPAGDMWNILSFIRNTFRIPTCRYSFDKPLRPCIQHQIKRCDAPCDGSVDHAEYMRMIHEIRLILEGKNRHLLDSLEKRMQLYSDELCFEEAAVLRDRISAIRKISESQKMVAPELGDLDVIGLSREGEGAAFKLFFIRNGIMTGYRQFLLDHTSGETDQGLLRSFIEQFYAKEIIPPRLLACSVLPEDRAILATWLSEKRDARVLISLPERGIKKELVAMAVENAALLLKAGSHGQDSAGLGKEVAELLGLLYAPVDIGAFDVSNISGKEPVAAFVYWKDGGFRKEHYRHIKMDAVKGPDDYAMMREMVIRTFGKQGHGAGGKGQEGDKVLSAAGRNAAVPDLVIIDGGKGQLEAAMQGLAEIGVKTSIIGIAKDPDRAFIPGRAAPVGLEDGRRGQLLLKRIRDEVHRFAISYHKKLRARRMLESPLEKIPGIARKRRLELLRHFGSIEGIRSATVEEISGLKGFNRTIAVRLIESLSGNHL